MTIYKYPMIKWAKDLFPLCRSLTGEGTQKTLRYFKKINPEFKILSFKSGQKVFDWIIPDEWSQWPNFEFITIDEFAKFIEDYQQQAILKQKEAIINDLKRRI